MAGDNAGTESLITVTVHAVKERQLPAADDDFAQLASEFDTLDELKEDLREQVKRSKETNRAAEARDALITTLRETEVPLPQGVIDAEVEQHFANHDHEATDEHRAEVIAEVETALKTQIILDTLAERFQVKISQGELIEFLLNTARQYGQDPNEFITSLDRSGQIPGAVAEVARAKGLVLALREVAIVDGAGNAVDLSEYLAVPEDDQTADASDDDEADADEDAAPASTAGGIDPGQI